MSGHRADVATGTPRYQGQLPFNSVIDADVLSKTSSFVVVPPPRKIVRKVCRENNNRRRDQAKKARAAGRETIVQKVDRCLSAYKNLHTEAPTPAELTRYMFEHGEIKRFNLNYVAPRLSEGINGKVVRDEHGNKVRRGGGLFVQLPLRLCKVNGDYVHPVDNREAGSQEAR